MQSSTKFCRWSSIIIDRFRSGVILIFWLIYFLLYCYFRDRLNVVDALLNSATSTRTRQLLAQKEKELKEMTKTRSTSTRTREKLAEVEVALKMEMEKKTSTRTR